MKIIKYTKRSLENLQSLAQFFIDKDEDSYADSVGAHIRHIIEHYEALIFRNSEQINYDERARNELLENDPAEVVRQIKNMMRILERLKTSEIDHPLQVSCSGGSLGQDKYTYSSNVGRELCFLNSHCVHHLAIIKPTCMKLGVPLDEYFGYAPSTIAFLESQKMEAL
jgi:hypothetical protein